MKHTRCTLVFGMLALILAAGWVQSAAQAQWKAVVPQTLFDEKLRMAAFFDESFGLTGGAGDIGKADYTRDGGKTWATAASSGG